MHKILMPPNFQLTPSPALYQVPVAHPPANTIPIPKTKDPKIVPITGNVSAGTSIIFKFFRISKPIL